MGWCNYFDIQNSEPKAHPPLAKLFDIHYLMFVTCPPNRTLAEQADSLFVVRELLVSISVIRGYYVGYFKFSFNK